MQLQDVATMQRNVLGKLIDPRKNKKTNNQSTLTKRNRAISAVFESGITRKK